MKKILPIILVSIMMFALIAAPVNAGRGGKLEAAYGDVKIDGKFDEWAIAEFAALKVDYHLNDAIKAKSAQVKSIWNEDALYFYVEATDTNGIQEKEMFEFYFDEAYDKSPKFNKNDRQSRIYLQTGEITTSTNDEDGNDTGRAPLYIGSKTVADGNNWKMEAGFKWTGNTAIKAGMTLGLEFMWDTTEGAIRWTVDTKAGESAPYQSTEFWGELVLLEEVIVVEEEEAPAAAATADPITAAIAVVALLGSGIVVSKVRK
jgi:hypothetical protein